MSDLTVGYAAMLEQFHPSEAVRLTALAEEHGFSGCMAADHFQPWVPQQGQAGFVWNVLTAVGERTQGDLGPGVTCPSFRFHPAIVAQAAATLEAMYPGRTWLGLGTGEALNEHVVPGYWPEAGERSLRMWEAIELISKLFTASLEGKDVKHDGRWFRMETTRLWTMPEQAPPIMVATAGPINAKKTGKFADGMITVGAPLEKIEGLFGRFADGAREAVLLVNLLKYLIGRIRPRHLFEQGLYGFSPLNTQWGMNSFPSGHSQAIFAAMAKLVRPEDFEGRMVISSDPDVHRAAIQKFVDLGFDRVYLHNVGRNQEDWIRVFGEQVVPKLHR